MTHKHQILVIEDSESDLAIMKQLEDKYIVRFANSAAEALYQLSLGDYPEIILLDVMMPTMSGFEFCKKIKQDDDTKLIPIIFVSGLDDIEDKTVGFDVGGVDYVTKPFNIKELEIRIDNHIRLNQQAKLLESIAFSDPLTNVANRRRYDDALETEWLRCIRHNQTLSLLVIDIDFFKQYNDLYGHDGGDKCLMIVAELLSKLAGRPGDLFARYGGEEFVLLLPECKVLGAQHKAIEALDIIRNAEIPHAGSSIQQHLSISIGVGSCKPARGKSPEDLFKLCDSALYKVKQSTRNGYGVAEIPETLKVP